MDKTTGLGFESDESQSSLLWVGFLTVNIWLGFSALVYFRYKIVAMVPIKYCCCCWVTSVVSDSVWPHRWQPTRLPIPEILQARVLEWDAIAFSGTLGYVCVFQFWFPQGICLVVGLLGDLVVLFLVFKGNFILFSIVAVTIYIPTNSARRLVQITSGLP